MGSDSKKPEYRHLPPLPREEGDSVVHDTKGVESELRANDLLGTNSEITVHGGLEVDRDQQTWETANGDELLYIRLLAVKKTKELLEKNPGDPRLEADLFAMEEEVRNYKGRDISSE